MDRLKSKTSEDAFTLLEIIITLGLILVLSIALTTLLRDSLDIRDSLSQTAKVNHRLATAMATLVKDLEHAYIISDRDLARYGDPSKRKVKSIFKLEVRNNGDDLQFTTMSLVPLVRNARASDTTFVGYKLDEDRETGRTNLMRAETIRVPENFRDEINYRVLAKGIKNFSVRAWRGDQWSTDQWDSRRREWQNKLPHMVKVELEAWEDDLDPQEVSTRLTTTEEPTLKLGTVVILPNSMESEELKERPTTLRWDKM